MGLFESAHATTLFERKYWQSGEAGKAHKVAGSDWPMYNHIKIE